MAAALGLVDAAEGGPRRNLSRRRRADRGPAAVHRRDDQEGLGRGRGQALAGSAPTRSSSAGPTSTSSAGFRTSRRPQAFLQLEGDGQAGRSWSSTCSTIPTTPRTSPTSGRSLLIGRKRQEREVDRGALSAWLRQQFVDDRPWNEIVYDLITAKGSNKENGAVNFPLAHLEFGAVPLTSITTRVFLGQQIQCTQCHDHPSNDWKQADFWGINAFFKGLEARAGHGRPTPPGAEVDRPHRADRRADRRLRQLRQAQRPGRDRLPDVPRRPQDQPGRPTSTAAIELGKFIADPKNETCAKAFVNRMWGHFMGRGFVHPVDDFGPHNPPSHPELLDELAQEFQASGYDVKALIRWIMASQAYNLTSVMTKENEKDETLFSHMALKPMTPEQLFDSLLTATAAHKAGRRRRRRHASATPGSASSSSPSPTTRARRRRASRARSPRP